MNKYILIVYSFEETAIRSFCSDSDKSHLIWKLNSEKEAALKLGRRQLDFLGMEVEIGKHYEQKIYTLDDFFERHYLGKHLK